MPSLARPHEPELPSSVTRRYRCTEPQKIDDTSEDLYRTCRTVPNRGGCGLRDAGYLVPESKYVLPSKPSVGDKAIDDTTAPLQQKPPVPRDL